MTFKHGSITTTLIDGGNVRLANLHDSLTIERADLDDAIVSLCAIRQLKDPEGYMALVDRLIPMTTVIDRGMTFRDVVLSSVRYRCVKCGRPFSENPGACFDCGSDIRPITGQKP